MESVILTDTMGVLGALPSEVTPQETSGREGWVPIQTLEKLKDFIFVVKKG